MSESVQGTDLGSVSTRLEVPPGARMEAHPQLHAGSQLALGCTPWPCCSAGANSSSASSHCLLTSPSPSHPSAAPELPSAPYVSKALLCHSREFRSTSETQLCCCSKPLPTNPASNTKSCFFLIKNTHKHQGFHMTPFQTQLWPKQLHARCFAAVHGVLGVSWRLALSSAFPLGVGSQIHCTHPTLHSRVVSIGLLGVTVLQT